MRVIAGLEWLEIDFEGLSGLGGGGGKESMGGVEGVEVVGELGRGEIGLEEMVGLEMVKGRLDGLGGEMLGAWGVFEFVGG